MKAFAVINKQGQEIIFNGYPFRYIDAIIQSEELGSLPKGIYSSKEMIRLHEEWCNTYTHGHYTIPKLEGVIVPNGTLKKLGIKYKGIPVEL